MHRVLTMPSQLEKPRDAISGTLVLATGAAFLYFGRGLTVGSASRMGPGYFPIVLSLLMVVLGLAIIVNALRSKSGAGEALTIPWRALVLVLGSIMVFALTLKGLGLFISLALCILATTMASSYTKWIPSITLALVLSLVCAFLFVYALGLPIPIIGQWLSFGYWWPSASPSP
ncbi:tripartite tricarboxylate transporter TctB family protein [Mesorhizobium sp. B2-5-3]|uniref:tripartite tricarboxylate transporter TctB family protein n=1 Tax=Mesorhizobium sp. B2-5-3 TaxID=2589927 RepID=UPI0011285486|nr:tripartite tricarboxylate transporter TctB family protein [Mesorhizobium sp. B2-5-3]TPK33925.1 tripartite tricarboxylate transporter TctB family protein [Mesorhizobium sp. B2-5-3]